MEHAITTLVFAYSLLFFIWFTHGLLTNKYNKNTVILWIIDGVLLWWLMNCPIFPWSVF